MSICDLEQGKGRSGKPLHYKGSTQRAQISADLYCGMGSAEVSPRDSRLHVLLSYLMTAQLQV